MKVTIGKYKDSNDDDEDGRVIKVKIDDWDIWNLDHTLALIILPALKKYKEVNFGYPCTSKSKNPVCGQSKPRKKCDCRERWDEIVDKMIWSFEEILEDRFVSDMPNGYHEHQKKIQEGLMLFGKYYQTLWT